jgi:hypothetical protein
MAEVALRDSQMAMARYLRDPANNPPPVMEPRRLKIYEELIYKNIEGFIRGGFPVLRSLYEDADWHGLVRLFIDRHRCNSPYFPEISQEFLRFLMQDFPAREVDPPFIAELAHYEWVELALDIAEEELPAQVPGTDILGAVLRLSPLALSLRYQYPVHRIGPGFRPREAGESTYLVVYRNRADEVRFMELNAVSSRLLEKIADNRNLTGGELLLELARELGTGEASVLGHGGDQLRQFVELSVVLVTPV